jgi:hypothetical protein
VCAAELCDGIVSELREHTVVQLLRPFPADRSVACWLLRYGLDATIGVAGELVEEEASDGLGGARVSSEQRSFHDLGQARYSEDRQI